MTFVVEVAVAIGQFGLSFYGFWLVWRVLLPALPGPPDRDRRIAPYACYFTDPFVVPVANVLHVSSRVVAAIALGVVSTLTVALGHLPALV